MMAFKAHSYRWISLIMMLGAVAGSPIVVPDDLEYNVTPVTVEGLMEEGLSEEVAKEKILLLKEFQMLAAKLHGIDLPERNLPLSFGDTLLTKVQLQIFIERIEARMQNRERRSIADFDKSAASPWTLPIKYDFNSSVPAGDITVIKRAMAIWEANTCVRFQQVSGNSPEHKIIFLNRPKQGCSSYIGNVSYEQSPQYVQLESGGCTTSIGTPIHELGHALGLNHEQSRLDRDSFVTIEKDNIHPEKLSNFEIRSISTSENLPYEYGSVMHYAARNAFAIDKAKNTITPKDEHQLQAMGQRSVLSFLDAQLVNKIYCDDICATKLNCKNNGYTDPNNCSKCMCPDGLGGTLCTNIAPSDPVCGSTASRMATETEQCFSSPNKGSIGVQGVTHCYWHIEAPAGRTIEVRVPFTAGFARFKSGACLEWVEVKDTKDVFGLKYCSPAHNHTFTSETNDVLAILSADVDRNDGAKFDVCYRLVPAPQTESSCKMYKDNRVLTIGGAQIDFPRSPAKARLTVSSNPGDHCRFNIGTKFNNRGIVSMSFGVVPGREYKHAVSFKFNQRSNGFVRIQEHGVWWKPKIDVTNGYEWSNGDTTVRIEEISAKRYEVTSLSGCDYRFQYFYDADAYGEATFVAYLGPGADVSGGVCGGIP